MKKNGFVFIESIVVLVVVALSLAMLISSYSLVKRKTQEKEYYDKASDKYLLYAISNLGTDDKCNYSKYCPSIGGSTFKNSNKIGFRADASGGTHLCTNSKLGKIVFNCEKLFEEMHIVHIYVVENIHAELKEGYNPDNPDPNSSIMFYDSGTLEYMKSLKKCNDDNFNEKNKSDPNYQCLNPIKYMIGVFERENGELHYASIELSNDSSTASTSTRNGWVRVGAASPIYDQQWYYYVNDVAVKGLKKLNSGHEPNDNYYYYFDNNSGIMQVGWVYYDGAYHLFSPIDNQDNGNLDGSRIQSMSDVRIKVRVNNSKDFYLDRAGSCYTCASGNCACSASDVSQRATSIELEDWHNYVCNGDECLY